MFQQVQKIQRVIQLLMKSKSRKNWSLNHSIANPCFIPSIRELQQNLPSSKKHFTPYKPQKSINPLTQRSRKHRLLQQKNLQIQKSNRILYERIRKIKLKNLYHSQKKIQPQTDNESLKLIDNLTKNLILPSINEIKGSTKSSTTASNKIPTMNSTKSYLDTILENKNNFVQKYFNDLTHKRKNKVQQKQLGLFITDNGWKVRVLLIQQQNLVLIGKKGRQDLTKKYIYSKVKDKLSKGLQEWVKYKFSFEN